MAAVEAREEDSVFFKTRKCRYFGMNSCTRGATCRFAHSNAELRSPPDLRYTKLCPTVLAGGSCQNRTCTYAHSAEERRKMGVARRTATVQARLEQAQQHSQFLQLPHPEPHTQQQRRPRQGFGPKQSPELMKQFPQRPSANTPALPPQVKTSRRTQARGCRGGKNLQRHSKASAAEQASALAVTGDEMLLKASDDTDAASEVTTDEGEPSEHQNNSESESSRRSFSKASSCVPVSEVANALSSAPLAAKGDIITVMLAEGTLAVKNTFFTYVEPESPTCSGLRRTLSAPCVTAVTSQQAAEETAESEVAKREQSAKQASIVRGFRSAMISDFDLEHSVPATIKNPVQAASERQVLLAKEFAFERGCTSSTASELMGTFHRCVSCESCSSTDVLSYDFEVVS
eukprot:TRINITY_DN20129_c0_g6_i1.p1 TRINITY_DN20129_c0_g6~~TRINITY_DN20129_c0_g6_i1.p1  ORF type:complete len:429 (+),score=68.43 TRINITY_DN20129_c0_g6_i1:83-1288(+)